MNSGNRSDYRMGSFKFYLDFSELRRTWAEITNIQGRYSVVGLVLGMILNALALLMACLDALQIELKDG